MPIINVRYFSFRKPSKTHLKMKNNREQARQLDNEN